MSVTAASITAGVENEFAYPSGSKQALPLRIVILMDHPSRHMVDFLDALADREDCAAQIVYCGSCDRQRHWGAPTSRLPHRFLPGMNLWGGVRVNPGIAQIGRETRADAWIVNSVYTSPTTLAAAFCLTKRGIPWIYMNEAPRGRGRLIDALKLPPMRFLLGRASGVLGTGKKAEGMYRELTGAAQPTGSVPYTINLSDFMQCPFPSVPQPSEGVHFLAFSRMISGKGWEVLLDACSLLPSSSWDLTAAGDGPLRRRLEREFRKRFPKEKVRFPGEVDYERRTTAFAGKHVFLLPSRWDGWGMVVPEAMAAGLPVISTDRVSSAVEFIRDGENGFIVPADDALALAGKMNWFIRNAGKIPEMGACARRSLADYRIDRAAETLVRFVSEIVSRPPAGRSVAAGPAQNEAPTWETIAPKRTPTGRILETAYQKAKTAFTCAAVCLGARRRISGNRILVYHLVLPEDGRRFEDHLRLLTDHYGVFAAPEAAVAVHDSQWCAITFDDGFRVLMGRCLDLLEKYRIKASFFVPSGFVEAAEFPEAAARFSLRSHHYGKPLEPMGKDDLRLLVRLGHRIGSHGVFHLGLASIPEKLARRELSMSRDRIAEWTGVRPAAFAYPYGEIRSRVGDPQQWVKEAGYSCALTLCRGCVGRSADPLLLPREHVEGCWPARQLQYFLSS